VIEVKTSAVAPISSAVDLTVSTVTLTACALALAADAL